MTYLYRGLCSTFLSRGVTIVIPIRSRRLNGNETGHWSARKVLQGAGADEDPSWVAIQALANGDRGLMMVVRDSLRPFVTSNISLLRTPVRGEGGYISSLSRGEVDLLKKESLANFIRSYVQLCKYSIHDLKFNYASIEETLQHTGKDLISSPYDAPFNSIQYVPSASKYNPRQPFTPERIIPRGTNPPLFSLSLRQASSTQLKRRVQPR